MERQVMPENKAEVTTVTQETVAEEDAQAAAEAAAAEAGKPAE